MWGVCLGLFGFQLAVTTVFIRVPLLSSLFPLPTLLPLLLNPFLEPFPFHKQFLIAALAVRLEKEHEK